MMLDDVYLSNFPSEINYVSRQAFTLLSLDFYIDPLNVILYVRLFSHVDC